MIFPHGAAPVAAIPRDPHTSRGALATTMTLVGMNSFQRDTRGHAPDEATRQMNRVRRIPASVR